MLFKKQVINKKEDERNKLLKTIIGTDEKMLHSIQPKNKQKNMLKLTKILKIQYLENIVLIDMEQ